MKQAELARSQGVEKRSMERKFSLNVLKKDGHTQYIVAPLHGAQLRSTFAFVKVYKKGTGRVMNEIIPIKDSVCYCCIGRTDSPNKVCY